MKRIDHSIPTGLIALLLCHCDEVPERNSFDRSGITPTRKIVQGEPACDQSESRNSIRNDTVERSAGDSKQGIDLYNDLKHGIVGLEADSDFPKLLQSVVDTVPSSVRQDAISDLVEKWSELRPSEAIASILNLGPGTDRQLAIGAWFKAVDLHVAFDVISNHRESFFPEDQNMIKGGIVANARAKSSSHLANLIRRESVPEEYRDLIHLTYGNVSYTEGRPLSEVIEGFENSYLDLIASGWLTQAAIADARSAREALGRYPELDQFVPMVAEMSYRQNRSQTVDWLAGMPETEAKAEATAAVVRQWFAEDSLNASRWVGGMEPGPSRDKALMEVVRGLASVGDFSSAEGWLSAIDDDATRDSAAAIIRISSE